MKKNLLILLLANFFDNFNSKSQCDSGKYVVSYMTWAGDANSIYDKLSCILYAFVLPLSVADRY